MTHSTTVESPGAGRWVVAVLWQFAMAYHISFLALPPASSSRVALLAAVLWMTPLAAVRAVGGFVAERGGLFAVCVALLVYAAVLVAAGTGGDVTAFSRAANFLVFVFAGVGLTTGLFRGRRSMFLETFAVAAALQSGLIALSYVSPEYREWLATVLVQGGNIPLTRGDQVPGFSNSSGALLSLIQSLGVFASLAAMEATAATWRRGAWLLCGVLCASSTLLVGRTGLLASMAMMAGFLLVSLNARQRLALAVTTSLLLAAIWINQDLALGWLAERNALASATLDRAFSAVRDPLNDTSVIQFGRQPVPALTVDTWFGTGRVSTPTGNASGHDSGYIQTFFAFGLPMTVVFYGALAIASLSYLGVARRQRALLILVAIMFGVEIKEPFIHKYVVPWFLLSVASLTRHETAGRMARAGNDDRSP